MIISSSIPFHHFLHYLLRRDVTKLSVAVAIRNLGIGLVGLYHPVYVYLVLGQSLPMTMLVFAAEYAAYAMLVPVGGMCIERWGAARCMLMSAFFYVGYYAVLLVLPSHMELLPLLFVFGPVGMTLFWPALHTDFAVFSSREHRGRDVGKINLAMLFPVAVSPAVGGWILQTAGYGALFSSALAVLLAAAIPLFMTSEHHVVYSDSYMEAIRKVFSRKNALMTLGLVSDAVELSVKAVVWPLFMFLIAISYATMGGIGSLGLIVAAGFMMYMGRVSDNKKEVPWLLGVGSVWTALSWTVKYFVADPLNALLADSMYRISRTAAGVPFKAFFYDLASLDKDQADEFIITREAAANMARGAFFFLAALLFWAVPSLPLRSLFFAGAALALGFMLVEAPALRRKKRNA